MNFLTIDFEIASRYEYSPCAVSIFEFNTETKEQTELLSTLINPGNVFFDPTLIDIHGITNDMVKNAPNINSVLQNITNIINN